MLFGVVGHADFSRFAGIGQSRVRFVADYQDPLNPGPPPNASLDSVVLSRDHRYAGPGYLLYAIADVGPPPVGHIDPATGEAMGYLLEGRGDDGAAYDETWWLAHQPTGSAPRPLRSFELATIVGEFGGEFPDWDDLLFAPDNTCACTGSGPPRPAADGVLIAGQPMLAVKRGAAVGLTWDVATCAASAGYTLYAGAVGDFGNVTAAVCELGAAGAAEVAVADDAWWILTGNDGPCGGGTVASFGRYSTGERQLTGWPVLCSYGAQDVSQGCP